MIDWLIDCVLIDLLIYLSISPLMIGLIGWSLAGRSWSLW